MVIQPKTDEIIYFYHERAQKRKYAIVLERMKRHYAKVTATAVILTTQGTNRPHQNDYFLPIEETPDGRPTKVICDQPIPVFKNSILRTKGTVSEKSLREIRKKNRQKSWNNL